MARTTAMLQEDLQADAARTQAQLLEQKLAAEAQAREVAQFSGDGLLLLGAGGVANVLAGTPPMTPLQVMDPARHAWGTAMVFLALVAFGTLTRDGFSTLVVYLAPVYWFFLMLSGLAVIVLRRREPDRPRPYRVPFYRWLPLAFAACSGHMLWSSLVYV